MPFDLATGLQLARQAAKGHQKSQEQLFEDLARALALPSFLDQGILGSPTSGKLQVTHQRQGFMVLSTFTLTAARIPVTDAAGSGSYGTLKLFTFPQGVIRFFGARQNYTAFAEGAALTGGAGDAVFQIGLGTVAIAAAADGALSGTGEDIGADVAVTLSGGTGTGVGVDSSTVIHDGTATAATLNLNWSGSAATIDASSTIDVTATITVAWMWMGDD